MFGEISDRLYGTFLTAEAIGGFIGAILSGFVNKSLSSKRLMLLLACSGIMLMLSTPIYSIFHNVIVPCLQHCLVYFYLFLISNFSLSFKEM